MVWISKGSLSLLAVATLALLTFASSAVAAERAPQWTVTAVSEPTNFDSTPGSKGIYRVVVENTGEAPSNGGTVTVADTLPSGLVATSGASGKELMSGAEMSCMGLTCTYSAAVPVNDYLTITIPVEVIANVAASVTNLATVSGGGASEASIETPTAISSTPAKFGIAPGSTATVLSSDQAGAHPDLTVDLSFNMVEHGLLAGDPKETVSELPAGFVGDLADTPRCPVSEFARMNELGVPQTCDLSTQVGTVTLALNISSGIVWHVTAPVYNLTTNPGEIAKLGFVSVVFGVQGSVSLSPGDYGIRTAFTSIPQHEGQLDSVSLTVWGTPASSTHDLMRGHICSEIAFSGVELPGGCDYVNTKKADVELPEGQASTIPPVPYLTSPTECTSVPLTAKLTTTSWEGEEPAPVSSDVSPLTGCSLLEFTPAITAAPDTTRADTPAGFTFDAKMGQEGLVSPEVLSSADIENTTVTLPEGVVINPGQAAGLSACPISRDGVGVEGPPSCPSRAKVGEVEIETPVLKNKLNGNVYVLESNPPDLKLLVAPEDPRDGIYVKFIGEVHMNEVTGQLVTMFEKTPQLPFSDLKLSFSGGAQAALVTPVGCGSYTTHGVFDPWSGQAQALTSSSFEVGSGADGGACPASPLSFSPELIAGSTTDQAGAFTGFSMLLRRGDGQQRIERLQFKAPAGLSGVLSAVPLCEEPQAAQGTCSSASQIGHATVSSGPGPYPLVIPQPGEPESPIYLTGPYDGAPFGLAIVTHVIAGPFNLGTILTRAKIEIDPRTAQITVTTDPLPQIIDGVPTDLRLVDAVIDRKGFMINPTSCEPSSFSGTASGAHAPGQNEPSQTATIASHFQVGSCAALKFTPSFTASTSAKTSKRFGASLHVDLGFPKGSIGGQANIREVKVELPRQLPSRLETLQRACLAEVFDADPARCPPESRVGSAKAVTPILPVPLQGPAYFVSYGGAKFPELVLVLQGDGVTVDLHGETFINEKTSVTSSTFKTVPDQPVESFELTLPEGKYSALGTSSNLCKASKTITVTKRVRRGARWVKVKMKKKLPALSMPTTFIGQNGAKVRQTATVGVTGCGKGGRPSAAKRQHQVA